MISIYQNKLKSVSGLSEKFNLGTAERVHSFHKTFPGYQPTPLIELTNLSKTLNVNKIWLKDESKRFGLNAFKVLGASYAIAKIIFNKFGFNDEKLSYSIFRSPEIADKVKELSFVTATDGNHGRGVAWTAQQIGCKAVVYMPKGTTQIRLENIKSLGADVLIINGNYDDAVNLAKTNAEKFGWILVQDSSWEGYENIPMMIMQGYLTLMGEIFEQLKDEIPTHVFVQCGVGSLPAAVIGYFVEKYGKQKPVFSVVEPEDSGCMYESVSSGKIITIQNEMKTIMAGLACGTPSKLAFDLLINYSDFFIKCSDEITIEGMKILGSGKFGDPKIISGESGAVTTGLVYHLLLEDKYKEQLNLDSESKILLISTEGNTDPDMYNKILGNCIADS